MGRVGGQRQHQLPDRRARRPDRTGDVHSDDRVRRRRRWRGLRVRVERAPLGDHPGVRHPGVGQGPQQRRHLPGHADDGMTDMSDEQLPDDFDPDEVPENPFDHDEDDAPGEER